MDNEKIFIQIASYRDPELVPTIENCIANATNPENLTFGICWQYDENDKWDNLDKYINNPNFSIMDVPWNKSKGLGWARHHIQKMWKGERYTLQLDSHHRFKKSWDTTLIEMMKQTNVSKPIITTYAAIYEPSENGDILKEDIYKMVGKKFSSYGTILFFPEHIEKKYDKPIPARFVSGHFYFTLGIHCCEYKYDPNIYFAGDEISLSIRSYTLGYDIFHPHKVVIYHYYLRNGRKKHWDDFVIENKKNEKIDKLWHEMNESSLMRLRQLLREEDNNIDLYDYGLGSVRTFEEYERYAGINFKLRRLHPDTVKGLEPPIKNNVKDWLSIEEKEYYFVINIPETSEFTFIYIGVECVNGEVLYRIDLNEYTKNLEIKFKSYKKPYKWVYWPVKNTEWFNRTDFLLDCNTINTNTINTNTINSEKKDILFITAFKDINRKDWKHYERTNETYLRYFYNLAKNINYKLIVYVEENIKNIILKNITLNENIIIKDLNEVNTFYSKFIDNGRKIIKNKEYTEKIPHYRNWLPEHLYAEYNLITNSKINFVGHTKKLYPDYLFYTWIDFGRQNEDIINIPKNINFNLIPLDKITFYCINETPAIRLQEEEMLKSNTVYFLGSSFIIPNFLIEKIETLWENKLIDWEKKLLTDDDQNVILQIYYDNPELFYKISFKPIYNTWFGLYRYLRNDNAI